MRVFWLSFAILFLELTLIRYIPSYFRMLSFFSNFLLLSCFFGMSWGMLAGKGRNLFALSLPLSALVVGAVTYIRPGANIDFKQSNILFFGSEFLSEAGRNFPLVGVLLLVFLVFGMIFYGLGQELMKRLEEMPSLEGYSANLWGSLVGSATFTTVSVLGVHPALWFLLAGLSLLPCWPRTLKGAALFGLSTLLLAGGAALDVDSSWSPYNRVEFRRMDENTTGIYVNGISHQQMFAADKESAYAIPYRGFMSAGAAAPDVVIVGAGSGNDVAAALDSGVKSVQAVEIDPVINHFGVLHHPRKPYSDPRVTRHITDGRRFLRSYKTKVDIVSFGLVDSLTLLSGFASTRLENNLFTQDSFADAKNLLRENGCLVVYNDFRESWLIARYYHQLVNLFGAERVCLLTIPMRERLSVRDGSIGAATAILLAGNIESTRAWMKKIGLQETRFDETYKEVIPATDNWPFPYLRKAEIPAHNLWSAVLLLTLSAVTLRLRLGTQASRIHPKMFWLGAGFMLIETRGIGRMSLLFGTTWRGSSLSILAVLALALVANYLCQRYDLEKRSGWLLIGLLSCLCLDALVPTTALLDLEAPLRLAAASLLLFSPMFFSGLMFSSALRNQSHASLALGSNLLGAMLGGALENFTTILGVKGLLAIAAGIYLIANRSK
jgi:spermidine synthase